MAAALKDQLRFSPRAGRPSVKTQASAQKQTFGHWLLYGQ